MLLCRSIPGRVLLCAELALTPPLFTPSLELDQLRVHMYVKWHHAWGRRVEGPNPLGAAMDMSGSGGAMTADEYDAQMMTT